jgi:hypothetical protein
VNLSSWAELYQDCQGGLRSIERLPSAEQPAAKLHVLKLFRGEATAIANQLVDTADYAVRECALHAERAIRRLQRAGSELSEAETRNRYLHINQRFMECLGKLTQSIPSQLVPA